MKEILQELAELNEPRMMNPDEMEEGEDKNVSYEGVDNQDLPTMIGSIKVMMNDDEVLQPRRGLVNQGSVTADTTRAATVNSVKVEPTGEGTRSSAAINTNVNNATKYLLTIFTEDHLIGCNG